MEWSLSQPEPVEPTCSKDWNPGAYDRLRGLRLRPALDLIGAVSALADGDVVDLGCGAGAAARHLKDSFCTNMDRRLIGVDRSAAMLDVARKTGAYGELHEADISDWRAEQPPALIFANASLHWLPHHRELLPRLSRMLCPGGQLAVQMPGQNVAPSHTAWRNLTGSGGDAGILETAAYLDLLEPLGQVSVWETQYLQVLPASNDRSHPVRIFTSSTYGKPFLDASKDPVALCRAYDARMEQAYPLRADGTVVFPFRRVFFVLRVP